MELSLIITIISLKFKFSADYVAATIIALLMNHLIMLLFIHTADPDDPLKTTDQTRRLGLIVCLLLTYCSQTNFAETFSYL